MGFRHIELSGGTHFYPNWLQELQELQARFSLHYRCHNYFPPPITHFVLNLASKDPVVSEIAISHVTEALRVSKLLGADVFGFHAGFRFDPKVKQLGKKMDRSALQGVEESWTEFDKNFTQLNGLARNKNIKLYIENNVFSSANASSFGNNPFLMTHADEIEAYKQRNPFNLLLDVAHLKVSCQTLGLDFTEQCITLGQQSDYLHLSDNDGFADTNRELTSGSHLVEVLSRLKIREKTTTLEVYSGEKSLFASYDLVTELCK
ncbi:hypothetical protein MACH26_32700 [Planctobacterium marinum]|uniref:Xylose isomerase-like TIM barrel domain-containing protein n=2 Tax=Planctobacterium marinum TaxID=1631968 RepID=A0AA48HM38_9ALTE|nr:hypothetical protein MACH26_32700 [Planctobacterium marinum]